MTSRKKSSGQEECRALWNASRSPENADFYTVGYGGRETEEVLHALAAHDVRVLVDIRHDAISRFRPEFSKNNLKRAVEALGIRYVHMRELGVPRHIRKPAIAAGTPEEMWPWYDKEVVAPFIENDLQRFLQEIERPFAMLCAEFCPQECHRHRLALALEAKGLRGFDL